MSLTLYISTALILSGAFFDLSVQFEAAVMWGPKGSNTRGGNYRPVPEEYHSGYRHPVGSWIRGLLEFQSKLLL
ncbi:hypothetical protein FB45DRAFT_920358 [Roridomyces roridus]|uniref:Secreted protein n=1 Tax=Roridomyces roridus TaxID=1738132 RepID=A0AAD7BPE7_9AGAR|nr:hypothetical protein FB45DRAFT_920358 [Roridomyces roridus]